MAVGPLRALVEAGHEVVLVVSQPDRRRGRGGALVPSPVKAAALELDLPVSDKVDDVIGSGTELGVVVAFGRLIKPHVLDAVPMVNLHFSLLPRWRGAAPVEWSILSGDTVTGAAVMALEAGLDTGPVYAVEETEIGPDETADELRSRLAGAGTALLLRLLDGGLPEPTPQEGEATYARKLEPDDHHLDWSQPAAQLYRVVRLGQAWTTFRGKRLRILAAGLAEAADGDAPGLEPGEIDPDTLRVGTGDGALQLADVQPEGRGPQPAAAWRNGARLEPGDRLGT